MLHYNIPAELITEARTFEPTATGGVLKPLFGSVGAQAVEFREIEIYDGVASMKKEREVRRKEEVCLIKNDKFSTAAVRVKDMQPWQIKAYGGLYDQFKEQRESNETRIARWDAINDNNKAQLLAAGVSTVEQLYAYPDDSVYKLGPSGKEFKELAKRHLDTKHDNDPKVEIELLLKENARLKAEAKEKEEAFFKAQALIAEQEKEELEAACGGKKKPKGKPKPKSTEEESNEVLND